MRNRSALFCLSLVTAVLCGAWSAAAAWTGLIGWAGFAGCTTYFSSGEHGIRGIKKSLIPNLTGILCGMCILGFGHMIPLFQSTGIWCAVLTFVMCIIARFRLFSFCPGTFMGSFSTFAADGNWLLLIPSIAVGVCLGAACEYGGTRLFQAVAGAEEQSITSVFFDTAEQGICVSEIKRKKEKKEMNLSEILSKCDHTLLTQTAVWEDIKALCDDGMKYKTASVCIPSAYVKQAKEYVGERLAICTVIGFPNGYETTAAKCFMAADAVDNGADEVDMVINIGWAKDGKWEEITSEIREIKKACKGKILKVIIETCLLTEAEKIELCKCVSDSGADYIKTSTGFSTAGATFDDVRLFAAHVASYVKIKAAGGISSLEDAEKFLALGADRLGTSRIVKIAKAMEAGEKAEDDGSY